MIKSKKQDLDASPEQIEWDKNSRKATILWSFVIAVFMAACLAAMSWILVEFFTSLYRSSGTSDALSPALGRIFGLIIVTMIVGSVLKIFARMTDYKLGSRPPKGGFKYREIKPIDATIEKVDENLRLFHVDQYVFNVRRIPHERLFRKPVFSYGIQEANGKINLHYTLSDSVLNHLVAADKRAATDDEITEQVKRTISGILEDYTEHFTELSYSI